MNQTIKDLLERRSCRSFKDDPIPEELLQEVLKAGSYAPSAMGRQATRMLVIQNKALRDRMMEDNAKIVGVPGIDPFYGAPVIIVVLRDKSFAPSIYDGSLVMGNLMNAAHALGLGSIWIHRAKEEFEMNYYKNLLKEYGIEGEFEGVGHCALGYIKGGIKEPAPRMEDHIIYIK